METWTTDLACPRCSVSLFAAKSGSVTLSACGACGGVWIENEAAQRLVRAGSREAVDLAEIAAKQATVFAVPGGPGACPVCRETLRRVLVPPSLIEIDVCDAHGTWFDRRELNEVVKIVAPRPPSSKPEVWITPPSIPAVSAAPAAPAAPAQPFPSARQIAFEIVREEERREINARIMGDIFDWLVKN